MKAYGNGILEWDISKLSKEIRNKQVSPVEVTNLLIERISQIDPKINAYITVLADQALKDAQQAEQEIIGGQWKGPLHGIPIGLKDNIYTKNVKTTMGSKLYENFVPDYDAFVVEKLKQSGAIMIGKLNLHEFAFGPTGDRSYTGPVRNPYDLTKMTGGSSSGSGAAVAAALCYGALGTDTGGSIRTPSSMCGIVGMKPTYGLVSKYGVFPTSWMLDHVGPMTRTVRDNAILLNVLSGHPRQGSDAVSTAQTDFTGLLNHGIEGKVIGVPSSFYFENIASEVKDKISEALEVFKNLGAEVRTVAIKRTQEIAQAQQMIIKCDAYAVHEESLRNEPELYDSELKERLLGGFTPKASEYIKARRMKQDAIQEFNKALAEHDVLLAPTLPIVVPDIEQREVDIDGFQEPVRSAATRLSGLTNFTGFPSLQIPCGFSRTGLPIGLQLIGKPFEEANLYRFAHAFEEKVSIPNVKMNIG